MNRMKDLFWMAVIVLFAAFSSCSDDKNDGTDEGVEAKLLTFGFYAEDNSSILSDDYIATLSSTTAKVTMPAFIDKSALVARFTTNDGNIVLVDGVTQVSGATANDFTAPVDYIVSNGKQNVKYTITVAKSSNMAWVRMPDFTATSVFSGSVLKINPVDQVPYLGFKLKEEEKMAVIKLVDGTTWTAVGSLEGFGGEVSLSNYDFDIDKDGIPYVVYSDNSATTVAGAASLMKWNGTTWNYVGNQGFVNAQSQQLHLRVLDNGETIVSQVNNSNKVSFPRRVLVMSIYQNSWASSELPLLASGTPIYNCNLAKTEHAAYLLVVNRGAVAGVNYGHSVYEYKNGTWSILLNNYVEPNATQTGIVGLDIEAEENGTLYILTSDDAVTSGVYNLRLKKYDPVTKQWSTVGGNPLPLDFKTSTSTSVAISIAPDGTPFVAYRDEQDQDYPKVIYLDNETKQWSDPHKLADIASSNLNIAFSSTGVGYISFTRRSCRCFYSTISFF